MTAGQFLEINASGTVRFDTTSIAGVDPNGVGPGWDGTQTLAGDPLPTAIHLSLIGRIGEIALPEGAPGGGLGFVGSSYSQVTTLDGRLYLGFNDDYYVDNSGAFSVTITTAVPDTGSTIALLGIGIVTLGCARRRWAQCFVKLAVVAVENRKTGAILTVQSDAAAGVLLPHPPARRGMFFGCCRG